MDSYHDAPAPSRTGDAAQNPTPRREDAAVGAAASGGQNRAPGGDDADRQANSTATGDTGDTLRIAYVRHKSAPVHAAESLTWPTFVAKFSVPQVGAKDGPGWMPAGIQPGPRLGERVESVTALVLDIEAKTKADPETHIKTVIGPEPPTPCDCAAEIGLWGWSACVHTSHSHLDPTILPADQAHPRYRLILRLSRPLTAAEIRPLGLPVLALLGLGDCADLGCLEPARLFYLPRCPAERLEHFEHHLIEGNPLDVDTLLAEAQRETAAARERPPHPPRTGNVIQAFNAAHDVGALLERHGYIRKGLDRWLHPESTTGAPGVRLLPGADQPRVYSSHGPDPLNDGHAHDAFDVYRILDHGGDIGAAVKAAAGLLGLGSGPRERPRNAPADHRPDIDGDPGLDTVGAEAEAVIRAAIARLPDDPGACLTDKAVAAWSEIYSKDLAAFERLRAEAKRAGARVAEIDKIARQKAPSSRKRNTSNIFGENPSDPFGTRDESLRDPSEIHPNSEGSVPYGALLYDDDDGKQHRLIESKAAEKVAKALKGTIAWDGAAGAWLTWRGTHWEPQTVISTAERLIADAVHHGTGFLGYRPSYLNGITQIAQRRGLWEPPEWTAGVVPFANGLLDLATRALLPATPTRALNWCLPHRYDPQAQCPAIRAWLLRCVENDLATVELLRAWLAALLLGLPLQKFLLLLGRGGSGKGTFQRLAIALVGILNNAVCALRNLEENRFELAKLYGKRLCTINEAGKHGGSLNMLKAVTGGDHLPLERKHVQQSGSFIFGGLVLLATNEDLQSTDSTSGLERRRITVRFPVSATPAEKAAWEARGGEEAVLLAEIPGLINWLLELSPEDIRARIDDPPDRVVTDNLLGMAAGNSVADWLLSETVPEPDTWTQIGIKEECRDPGTGKTYYKHADERLYPSYLRWCLANGRSRPVSIRKFRDTVVDMAETLGHPVESERDTVTRAHGVTGLRLARKDDPAPEESWKAKGRIEPLSRMDRKDSGLNFGQGFSQKEDTGADRV